MSSRNRIELEIPLQASKHSNLALMQRHSLQLSPDDLSRQEMSRQTHTDSNPSQLLPGAQAGKTDLDEDWKHEESVVEKRDDERGGFREHFKGTPCSFILFFLGHRQIVQTHYQQYQQFLGVAGMFIPWHELHDSLRRRF
jgi:hypothetical protein